MVDICASVKRKRAVASVIIKNATEDACGIQVNGKSSKCYFFDNEHHKNVLLPFEKIDMNPQSKLVILKIKGGGVSSQSQAAKVAIARALQIEDPTRSAIFDQFEINKADVRKKERKKYGMPKARKKPQFSKR